MHAFHVKDTQTKGYRKKPLVLLTLSIWFLERFVFDTGHCFVCFISLSLYQRNFNIFTSIYDILGAP